MEKLLQIKREQLEAFERQDWEAIAQLETTFQQELKQNPIHVTSLDTNQMQLIQEFISLHKVMLEKLVLVKQKNLDELIDLKKHQAAAKAYSNR